MHQTGCRSYWFRRVRPRRWPTQKNVQSFFQEALLERTRIMRKPDIFVYSSEWQNRFLPVLRGHGKITLPRGNRLPGPIRVPSFFPKQRCCTPECCALPTKAPISRTTQPGIVGGYVNFWSFSMNNPVQR